MFNYSLYPKKVFSALQVAGICLLLLVIGEYIWGTPPAREDHQAPIASFDPEHANPVGYLQVQGTILKGMIQGKVSNQSSHTGYKDLVVKVTFLSPTGTVTATKFYTISNDFPYGLQKTFSLTVDKPQAAVTCGLEIVHATSY